MRKDKQIQIEWQQKVPKGLVVLTDKEYHKLKEKENILKRFVTISPTEAEMENKALKETIGIVLAQKKSIWDSYNKVKAEYEQLVKQFCGKDGMAE